MSERFDPGKPSLAGVIIDVPAPRFESVVTFWADALSATPEPLPGIAGGDAYVELHGARAVTDVLVQRIADADRPRFHLDVAVPDRDAAVREARAFGARAIHHEDGWDVLLDPAGLPMCLGFEDPEPLRTGDRRPDRGYLDAVFLDVQPGQVATEVAFWAAVLAATPVPPDISDPAYHELAGAQAVGGGPVAIGVQTTLTDPERDGAAAAPRVHVDLSVDDVDAEVARLATLGARYVATVADWVTLADPAGNLFCVVPTPEVPAVDGGGAR